MIKEWLMLLADYWWVLLMGAGLTILGIYVPWVRKGLFWVFSAVNFEKVRNDALMAFAKAVVKSTKNQLDDGWYNDAASKLGYQLLPPQKTNTATDKANK